MDQTQSPQALTGAQLAPLSAEHLPAVVAINREVQIYPWNLRHWQSSLLPSYRNWVVLNPEPIAYASLLLTPDGAELMNIGVAAPYQGRGLGKGLLTCAIQLLPDAVTTLYLEVRQSNKVARSLYESMGFRNIAKRANYYPVDEQTREAAMVYALENDGESLNAIDFYQGSGKLEGLIMPLTTRRDR